MIARRIHLAHTGLFLLLAAGAVACSSAEEEKKAAGWTCATADVPMGEVVRCTESALTMDGPPVDGTAESCLGSVDNPEVCPESSPPIGEPYECNAGEPECPPVGAGDSGGAGGTTDTSTQDGSSDGTQSDQGSASTPGGGAGSQGNGKGNGPSKGSDFGSAGPDECAYVPELPYCGGGASGGSPGGTSDGSSDGTSEHGKGSAPGQEKKGGGASDGPSSDGSSSDGPSSDGSTSDGSSGGGKGKHYKCVKDKKGNKSCESVPDCVAGTHPSACGACVADGDASDCVPPSAGGCWVTGGGFVIGPNDTTGAAADGHDNFGGNAKPMKDGRIQGHWNHVDHGTGNHAKGRPEYIVCRRVDEPGPGQPGGKKGFTMNQVYFGGPAEWRSNGAWAGGYWFDVVAKDHGEPGSVPHVKNGQMPDTYHFTIRLMDDPAKKVSGAKVYETRGVLEGGNIQMHPPNNGHPYTPMDLPDWVAFEP